MEWISVKDTMPKNGAKVLVLIKTNAGYWCSTAIYYPKYFKSDESDYEGDCEYNEETDEYYWPEGWYEYQFEPDVSYLISSRPVTYWMPVPPPPNTTEQLYSLFKTKQ